MKPVYLDYNAATPIDPRVLDAALPYFKDAFGNPSSTTHSFGWEADRACKLARENVARLFSCLPKEIYFTSGATESNNLAIQGVARSCLKQQLKCHIITSAVEHKAVLDVVSQLSSLGVEATILKPNSYGQITLEQIASALRPETRLVSLIHGNNEIGTLNPITEIGLFCRSKNILFHTDAAQTVGKYNFSELKNYCDLLSSSGQKIYAPKGIGFLFVREEIRHLIEPLFYGGQQERGLRPGTLNVTGIVAIGEACRILKEEGSKESERLEKCRDLIITQALKISDRIILNGHPRERLCNNINFTIKNMSSDLFALGLSGIAVSGASACSGTSASHVLKAIGLSDEDARSSLRIGIGRMTTDSDCQLVVNKIKALLDYEKSL